MDKKWWENRIQRDVRTIVFVVRELDRKSKIKDKMPIQGK